MTTQDQPPQLQFTPGMFVVIEDRFGGGYRVTQIVRATPSLLICRDAGTSALDHWRVGKSRAIYVGHHGQCGMVKNRLETLLHNHLTQQRGASELYRLQKAKLLATFDRT